MDGHAKKCVERYCELANKTTQQFYKVPIPCFDDLHFKEVELTKVWLSNCSEMLKLGTYWKSRYKMVSEQICTINHQMDRSMWQTIISFDLLHSSHKWIQTILSCGKQCKTMQIGTDSRLRFCRRSWGFEIQIKWNIVWFGKSHVRSNQLVV